LTKTGVANTLDSRRASPRGQVAALGEPGDQPSRLFLLFEATREALSGSFSFPIQIDGGATPRRRLPIDHTHVIANLHSGDGLKKFC